MPSLNNERGQGMTEYILITALIVVVAIAAFKIFRPAVEGGAAAVGEAIGAAGGQALDATGGKTSGSVTAP